MLSEVTMKHLLKMNWAAFIVGLLQVHKRNPLHYGVWGKNSLLCIFMMLLYFKDNEIDVPHWSGMQCAFYGGVVLNQCPMAHWCAVRGPQESAKFFSKSLSRC